uniref:Uncharacterized protein n=1 Tax=Brassica campestris TaxID=3711 RepID=A0A3P5ZQK8_BRACM|nr:unnamed protein product [Brassica rapa]
MAYSRRRQVFSRGLCCWQCNSEPIEERGETILEKVLGKMESGS